MQRIKKITAIILSVLTLSSVCVFGSSFSAGAKGTGAGLAEWALNAYNSGWSYVYGGSTPGAVDCSGLNRPAAWCSARAQKRWGNALPQNSAL